MLVEKLQRIYYFIQKTLIYQEISSKLYIYQLQKNFLLFARVVLIQLALKFHKLDILYSRIHYFILDQIFATLDLVLKK